MIPPTNTRHTLTHYKHNLTELSIQFSYTPGRPGRWSVLMERADLMTTYQRDILPCYGKKRISGTGTIHFN